MAGLRALGYGGLLRQRPHFRRLWLGELVSYLGDWFNTIAIYTVVQSLSSSAQAVALVMIAKTLPAFLVSPIAGPLIDRFDRRKLLLFSDFARALSVLGLIAAHRAESLAGLYAFTVLMMLFSGIAFPTKNAVLPMIVGREDLAAANALGGGTWSVMLAVGAALGGAVTEVVGVEAAFVIDGLTFLASAVFFWALPPLPPPREAGGEPGGERAGFVEGLRYLARTPTLLALALHKPMMSVANGALVLIPLFGNHFPATSGPAWVGYLFALRGAGALTGSMLLRLILGDATATLERLIMAGYLLIALGLGLVSLASGFGLVAVGFYLAAVGSGAIWVFSGTLIQLRGDPAYHGRVFSLEFGLTTLVMAGASWAVSFAVDRGVTLFEAARVSAVLALVPLVFWLLAAARRRSS